MKVAATINRIAQKAQILGGTRNKSAIQNICRDGQAEIFGWLPTPPNFRPQNVRVGPKKK